jgi:hypothetical protein
MTRDIAPYPKPVEAVDNAVAVLQRWLELTDIHDADPHAVRACVESILTAAEVP